MLFTKEVTASCAFFFFFTMEIWDSLGARGEGGKPRIPVGVQNQLCAKTRRTPHDDAWPTFTNAF